MSKIKTFGALSVVSDVEISEEVEETTLVDIFMFQMDEGPGALHVGDIRAILPAKNKEASILYSNVFPDGFTVNEAPEPLLCRWQDALGIYNAFCEKIGRAHV